MDAYEQSVLALVDAYVDELPKHEREAIWLQTDNGFDWDCEEPQDRDKYPVFKGDIVAHLLRKYVYCEAGRWSNARVRKYIERAGLRD